MIKPNAEVLQQARNRGEKIHVGSLMTIVSIKSYEKDASQWSIKARIVFRGDTVRDEHNQPAIFQDLASSAPSSLAGLNLVVAPSWVNGHKCSPWDCVKAYVQSELKTVCPTYVVLPPELTPKKFQHVVQPGAPLKRSLYGHPESSAHWQRHLAKVLVELGGYELENQPSVYFFPQRNLAMSVYVDDLTVSGPCGEHDEF